MKKKLKIWEEKAWGGPKNVGKDKIDAQKGEYIVLSHDRE